MAIVPVPSTRVPNLLVSSRLLNQLQLDQRELLRVQQQISTGQRLAAPSDDATSALRAMSLQRLLERKTQVQTNLATNQSYLNATDTALGNVASLLTDIRGAVVAVADSGASAEQRDATALVVEEAISQLLATANQQFRGRHLFGGTQTQNAPFVFDGKYVSYQGNEGALQSYSDLDTLFDSSIDGNTVFGALSEAARGQADLNPVVTETTRLADLNGGLGVRAGSIKVSDGTNVSVVDLSNAHTVGDVVRFIEANPPDTRSLRVNITPTGLTVDIDDAGGGTLTITEVGGGNTADDLGILETSGTLTEPIVGNDINPVLRHTTPLANAFGSYASASVQSDGANNDFVLSANTPGEDLNGVTVQFVDDSLLQAGPGVTVGSEVAEFDTDARAARASLSLSGPDNDLILQATSAGTDFNNVQIEIFVAGDVKDSPTVQYTDVAGTRRLRLGIDDSDETTLNGLVAAIAAERTFTAQTDASAGEGNDGGTPVLTADAGVVTGNTGNSGGEAGTLYVRVAAGSSTGSHVVDAINAEGTFTAEADLRDSTTASSVGKGTIDLDATAVTSGGSGTVFDLNSGIRIVVGDETHTLSFAGAETFEDLLNIINGSDAGVVAHLNAAGNGIDVRSRVSGTTFSIGENGGTTASQLGIRTFTEGTRLEDLNEGRGVEVKPGVDFTIERNDGTLLEIDLSGATTIGDVLDAINNHPENLDPTTSVTARLAEFGNGIELVDDDPTGADPLTVSRTVLNLSAVHLGLIPEGGLSASAGSTSTAATAVADLSGVNTDLTFTANQAGTSRNDVNIVFVNNVAAGDQALVNFDGGTNTLTIDVDPAATQASTVVAAVTAEGTFTAELNTAAGPNDGTGLITDTGTIATTDGGTADTLTAADVNQQQVEGVFNTLIRLKEALESDDLLAIERALSTFEEDITRVTLARGEIGARQRGLQVVQQRLDSEEIELRETLSKELDVDIAAAISEMTTRQIAMQASLRTMGSLLQVTLLNFL